MPVHLSEMKQVKQQICKLMNAWECQMFVQTEQQTNKKVKKMRNHINKTNMV